MLNRIRHLFWRLIGRLGRIAGNTFVYVLELMYFTFSVIFESKRHGLLRDKATRTATLHQVIFSGIDSLPSVLFLSVLIGISIAAQFFVTIDLLGEDEEMIRLLARLVALELGSLLTAFVLIGRSGSAITVDLGNMKVNRELDGLVALGIDVNRLFVFPRLLGLVVSQLVLAVFFTTIALLSGMIFNAFMESSSLIKYMAMLPSAFLPIELAVFMLKNLAFGLMIGATACFHGLKVGHSVTEVPQAAQRAIMQATLMVIVIDFVMMLVLQVL